jgi:aminoglycoside/choline kinase family phosphotransferase
MSEESTHDVIAATPEELTADWLTEVLRAGGHLGDAAVVDIVARPLGTGQMCDSLRLRVSYDGPTDAPTALVAKLPAADETSRVTAATLRSYEKEVRFYEQLDATLSIPTPTVFHVALDDEDLSRFVLLLEDLAPAEQGDQLAGCSPAVAAEAVRELVGLHAPRWGDPALGEIEWLRGDRETGIAMMSMLLPNLWTGFTERYDADLGDDVRTAGADLFAHLLAYLTPTGGPETVVHGDYRLDNLLLTPDGRVAGVVDWQTCTLGAALSDVAYFIGAGLTTEDRREHEERLVRDYHRGLGEAGVTGYGWDECWADYRRGTYAGLVMAVAASMLVERTARGDEMFLTMAARHSRHVLDHDAAELLAG